MSESNELRPERAVTVVIPDLNRRAKLHEAVRSVITQTRRPLEIVIVDDGSTPAVSAADFAYSSVPVRVLHHVSTLGGAAARNTGIQSAQTEWVAFLDSDDVWLPTRLEAQMNALAQSRHPVDVVVSNVLRREPGSVDTPFNHRALRATDDISRYLMVDDCALHSSSLLIRRSTLIKVPFDEQLRKHQDWDLLLRLQAASARVLYLHEPLAVYCAYRDGDRISERERDVQVSLSWMQRNRGLLAPDAIAYYYAYRCLPRAFRDAPSAAVLRLIGFAARSPKASRATLAGLQRLWSAFIDQRSLAKRY